MKASMPPFVKVSRTTETKFSPDSHVRGGETAQQRSQEGSDTRTPSLSAQPRLGWVHPPSTACLSTTDVSLIHRHLNLRRCVGATASTPSPPASLCVLPPRSSARNTASPPRVDHRIAGCTSHHADQLVYRTADTPPSLHAPPHRHRPYVSASPPSVAPLRHGLHRRRPPGQPAATIATSSAAEHPRWPMPGCACREAEVARPRARVAPRHRELAYPIEAGLDHHRERISLRVGGSTAVRFGRCLPPCVRRFASHAEEKLACRRFSAARHTPLPEPLALLLPPSYPPPLHDALSSRALRCCRPIARSCQLARRHEQHQRRPPSSLSSS